MSSYHTSIIIVYVYFLNLPIIIGVAFITTPIRFNIYFFYSIQSPPTPVPAELLGCPTPAPVAAAKSSIDQPLASILE